MYKTKKISLLFLIAIIYSLGFFSIQVYSYWGYSSFEGEWEAEVSERNNSVLVGLKLYARGDDLIGKFEILSDVKGDVSKGMSFYIENVKVRGDNISFIVLLFKRDDNDSLFFQLRLGWRGLSGTMREMHKNSKIIPVTFNKVRKRDLWHW